MNILKYLLGNYSNLICQALIIIILILVIALYNLLYKAQIRKDIEKRGGKFISKELVIRPFKRVTNYKVRYIDSDGKEHIAICNPSLLTGIYWKEDIVVDQNKSINNNSSFD
jgi:hypothetical protein